MKRGVIITFILNVVLSLLPYVVQAQRNNAAAVMQLQKLNSVYRYLHTSYVDSVAMESIVESGIRAMLEELDPHSVYLDKKEMDSSRELTDGEFSGIGVEYNVLNDTIIVVNAMLQGPAEKVGMMPNDRIVEIDGESVVGIARADVPPRLRGEAGSVVNVGVVRRGVEGVLHFSIKRDKIPITTVDAAFMAAPGVGYIKVNRFGRTTMQEFGNALKGLGSVEALILDLDNNGGGLLDQAVDMAGYFLPRECAVVSTEGRAVEHRNYYARESNRFGGRLVVMVNENSASGSEIVAGAVQDWDRGVVVGQASFGKGLVQSQIPLADGSAIRLTVARYHTPSGRVIQRPYERGHKEEYYKAHLQRGDNNPKCEDGAKEYHTLRLMRPVYADGGIMPDVKVEVDTTQVSAYLVKVIAQGVYGDFLLDYLDRNRVDLQTRYPTFEQFDEGFELSDAELESVVKMAQKRGVERDEEGLVQSRNLMKIQISALIAQRLYSASEYYRYINPRVNDSYKKSLELLKNWQSADNWVIK